MDNLERRLKEDAAEIRADVSDELAARIQASIRATERAAVPARGSGFGFSLWWISSLTGVAAALLLIALFNRGDPELPATPLDQPTASVVPDVVVEMQTAFPLRAETADLTEPLEEELERLRSDIDKARDNLEADLRESF